MADTHPEKFRPTESTKIADSNQIMPSNAEMRNHPDNINTRSAADIPSAEETMYKNGHACNPDELVGKNAGKALIESRLKNLVPAGIAIHFKADPQPGEANHISMEPVGRVSSQAELNKWVEFQNTVNRSPQLQDAIMAQVKAKGEVTLTQAGLGGGAAHDSINKLAQQHLETKTDVESTDHNAATSGDKPPSEAAESALRHKLQALVPEGITVHIHRGNDGQIHWDPKGTSSDPNMNSKWAEFDKHMRETQNVNDANAILDSKHEIVITPQAKLKPMEAKMAEAEPAHSGAENAGEAVHFKPGEYLKNEIKHTDLDLGSEANSATANAHAGDKQKFDMPMALEGHAHLAIGGGIDVRLDPNVNKPIPADAKPGSPINAAVDARYCQGITQVAGFLHEDANHQRYFQINKVYFEGRAVPNPNHEIYGSVPLTAVPKGTWNYGNH